MSSEEIKAGEATIPGWAPIVSCREEVGQHLVGLNLSYEDIARLVENRGVPREKLSNLHIHFTDQQLWEKFRTDTGNRWNGLFINEHSAHRRKHTLQASIGGLKLDDIKDSSFIIVDVPATLSSYQPYEAEDGLRSVVIHELEHFCEYQHLGNRYTNYLKTQRLLQMAFAAEMLTVIGTSRAEVDHSFYPLIGAIAVTGIGLFANQQRGHSLDAMAVSEESRVVKQTQESYSSGEYDYLLTARTP